MLSLKKGAIIRDLWEFRIQEGATDEQIEWQESAHKTWKSLLKVQDGRELKDYLSELRSGEGERHCWLVSEGEAIVNGESMSPQLLCARIFRWPDLDSTRALQRLDGEAGVCCSGSEPSDGRVCCSPFHFARRLPNDEQPLESSDHYHTSSSRRRSQDARRATGGQVSHDSAISVASYSTCDSSRSMVVDRVGFSSMETGTRSSDVRSRRSSSRDAAGAGRPGGGGGGGSAHPAWIMVRYGEFNDRVGKMEKLSTPGMEVFYREAAAGEAPAVAPATAPSSDLYALNLRLMRHRDRLRGVEERQRKVGRGFLLWRKSYQSVWLYNRSKYAVYVQSATLTHPTAAQLVHKVPSGRSLKIYDRARAALVKQWYDRHRGGVPGALDLHCCRISLTSGWGQDNPRHPTLLDCHCWLEVYFTFPERTPAAT